MSVPGYSTVIESFLKEALEPVLHNYVYNGYSTLANHLRAPLGIAIVLYIMLLGISITQGWVKLSMGNFVKSAIKIALLYSFAMHWGIFSHWIVDGVQNTASTMGDWLLTATPIPLPHTTGSGIDGAMQSVLVEFAELGNWLWSQGSWHNMGPLFEAIVIWGFGYALVLIALLEIVLAKIMLAILFTVAPFFISMTLFKVTHNYFDRWLGLIVGYAFLLIFVSAVIALSLSFAQWAIAANYAQHALGMQLISYVPAMVVCFIGIGIILKISHIAQSVGGAVSTASGSAMTAGAIGGFIGSSLSPLRTAAKGFSFPGMLNSKGTTLGAKLQSGSSNMINAMQKRLRNGG